jgi:O-antigen/teichoic acid export membrane protein
MRMIVLPITGISVLATQGIIIRDVGLNEFGIISLIINLPLLIPFADLGLSAAVVGALGRDQTNALLTIRVSWTILWIVAGALTISAIALHIFTGWKFLGSDSEIFANNVLLVLLLFSISVPFGIGQRILIGTGNVTTGVALQGCTPLITLALVWIVHMSNYYYLYYAAGQVSIIIVGIISCTVSLRKLGEKFSLLANFTLGSQHDRKVIFSSSIPMFFVIVGLPLALQTQRIFLSNFSSPVELSYYSIGMTLYAPIWSTVSAVGMNLWPFFIKTKNNQEQLNRKVYLQVFFIFFLFALLVATVFCLLAPYITRLWSGTNIPVYLVYSFAFLLFFQIIHLPDGMYLMDPNGLKFQSVCVLLMAISTLSLMFIVVPIGGSSAAVLAAAISILIFQLIPGISKILISETFS